MAGETVRSEAICLEIRPWSRTSHIVAWLTPCGKVSTIVKGAVRPKSAFLGQYDLNYTCEILYYARSKGELHALRDCSPLSIRDGLRRDYRALALADYCRFLVLRLAPQGPDSADWYDLLSSTLTRLHEGTGPSEPLKKGGLARVPLVSLLVDYELKVLDLMGLRPDFAVEGGGLVIRGERRIPVSGTVAAYLKNPLAKAENSQTPLDAARVISVFYQFHLDLPSDVRRSVLALISKTQQES